MTESRKAYSEFAAEMKSEAEDKDKLKPDFRKLLIKLAEKHDQEYLDHGAECVVLKGAIREASSGEKSEQLVAFAYKDVSPERAKEIFYLQRFFATLFPHNFPRFHSSSGKYEEKPSPIPSNTVRKYIDKHPSYWEIENEEEPQYPFADVQEICKRELGIDLNVDLTHSGNLLHGADGGEYYVDTIKTMDEQKWSWNRIKKYMSKHKDLYDPMDIRLVKASLDRLRKYFPQKYKPPEEVKKVHSPKRTYKPRG